MNHFTLRLRVPLLATMGTLLALLVLLALLTHTAALAAPVPDTSEAVTLTFWHPHSGSRTEWVDRLITEFNASNPEGITVHGEYAGGYGEIYQKVIAGLEGETPLPNLVVAYPNDMADFARFGAVRFLDDYLDDPLIGITDTADFYPGVLDYYRLGQYGNQLAGLQHGRSIEVMYYNATLLADAGLAVPTSWEAFETAAIALTNGTITGTIPDTDASRFANWLWSRGGQLVSEDLHHARFDQQAGVDSLRLFQRLMAGGYADLPSQWPNEVFGQGRVGFTFASSAGIPFYRYDMEHGANQAWGVTRVPAIPGHEAVDSYGAGVGIIHESEAADRAAWLFIRWLTAREQTARWAALSGYFPVRLSADTHPSMTQKLADDPQYAQAHALLPLGRSEPTVRGYNAIRDILTQAVWETLVNGADVTGTLEVAAGAADEVLAMYGPDSATISPAGGTLVYTGTDDLAVMVNFGEGALPATTTVSYVPVFNLPADGLAFALLPEMTFHHPVTLTVDYRDADVAGMEEALLSLYAYDWTSGSWQPAVPCGGYTLDTASNRLQAIVCHFSDYALIDRPFATYLPTLRN